MDKNYLEEVPNESKGYQLSTEGKKIKNDIISIFISTHQFMTEGITEDEIRETVEVLSKISTNLEGTN